MYFYLKFVELQTIEYIFILFFNYKLLLNISVVFSDLSPINFAFSVHNLHIIVFLDT